MRPRHHPRRPRPINPLAPLSEKALRRQTSEDVRAQVAPLAALINKNALAGSRNISGVASGLAAKLGPYAQQASQIYSGAEQNLGAIDNELANRLGAGDLAGDLKKRIAAAGGDTSLADALASASKGAAGAGFASGAAERGQLVSQGASAAGYASKLPGLAELSGLQGVSERNAQALKETGELTAKTPGLISQALAAARDREYQKAVARLGFQGDIYGANLTHQDRVATNQTRQDSNQVRRESNQVRLRAIQAENERSGKTLQERADYHNRTIQEQGDADAERARHNRQVEQQQHANEKGRERRSRRSAKTARRKKSGSGGSADSPWK